MPASLEHQGLLTLLLDCPRLLVWLLRHRLNLPVSENVTIRPGPESIHQLEHPDHHADGVLVLSFDDEPDDSEAYVIEVQLRIDTIKRWVWALYLSGTGLRLRCPTSLVVVTLSERVESWCSRSFHLGRGGLILQPLVIGPSNIPKAVDWSVARALPELAVLVVAAHGRGAGSKRTIGMALRAIQTVEEQDPRRARSLRRLVGVFAPTESLENIMNQAERQDFWERAEEHFIRKREEFFELVARKEGLAKGLEKGLARGLEKGLAKGREEGRRAGRIAAVLEILEARRLHPSVAQRTRITKSSDDAILDDWIRRATLVEQVDELFRERV